MNIVSDTNIFLAIALNEPEKERVIQLTTEHGVSAPDILQYEIGNALTALVKRNKLTQDEALSAYDIARQIPVRLVQVDIRAALQLAFEFKIYAYDAYFLQCAKSLLSPLLTLDKRLQRVARATNIPVLE